MKTSVPWWERWILQEIAAWIVFASVCFTVGYHLA